MKCNYLLSSPIGCIHFKLRGWSLGAILVDKMFNNLQNVQREIIICFDF